MYDLVVIGGGSAGLTAVDFAARLGARVALVEQHRLGGDCTWSGCVPSKSLLHIAQSVHITRQAYQAGWVSQPPQIDMRQIKAQLATNIETIYQHETPDVLAAEGIDVVLGQARFTGPNELVVDDRSISAEKFILCTGARPSVPEIDGLASVPFLTYEQIFENERLPEHLLVVGAGAIGVELSQAYARLGARVTLVDETFLPLVDPEAAALLLGQLRAEGVEFLPGLATAVAQLAPHQLELQAGPHTVVGDMLLVSTGRQPLVEGLDLAVAGVVYSEQGILIDTQLRTSAAHIFAAGDCTGGFQATHYAGWQGFQAVRNALLPGGTSGVNYLAPWAIFTSPEIAHVGLSEREARQQYGETVLVSKRPLSRVDRAVIDQSATGFIKVMHQKNGRLLGATVVAPRAGELINEFSLAITKRLTLRDMAESLHVYPSYGMGVQRLAANWAMDAVLEGLTGRFIRRFSAIRPRDLSDKRGKHESN